LAKRIAIVEDDPDQRANYADAISKKGYSVIAYGSRTEALAGFDATFPDLCQKMDDTCLLAAATPNNQIEEHPTSTPSSTNNSIQQNDPAAPAPGLCPETYSWRERSPAAPIRLAKFEL